jgi:hypothetical protein
LRIARSCKVRRAKPPELSTKNRGRIPDQYA